MSLKEELDVFGAADPIKYGRKKQAIQTCKDASVRWTGQLICCSLPPKADAPDNTMILMTWIGNMGMETDGLKQQMGIGQLSNGSGNIPS